MCRRRAVRSMLLRRNTSELPGDTGATITVVKANTWKNMPETCRAVLEAVGTEIALAEVNTAAFIGRYMFSIHVGGVINEQHLIQVADIWNTRKLCEWISPLPTAARLYGEGGSMSFPSPAVKERDWRETNKKLGRYPYQLSLMTQSLAGFVLQWPRCIPDRSKPGFHSLNVRGHLSGRRRSYDR